MKHRFLLILLFLMSLSVTINAQIKISALPAATSISTTDIIPIVDMTSSITKKITFANFSSTLVKTNTTSYIPLTSRYSYNLKGGAAYRIPYQSSSDTTLFITAPSDSNVLKYNTGALGWLKYSAYNNVSTLVIRDGSGNFKAGTVTLTGLNLNGNLIQTGNYSLYNNSYVPGWSGSGYRLDYGVSTANKSELEVDNLTIRGTFSVYELLLRQIRATNGSIFVSASAKVSAVVGTTITFEDPSASSLCPFAAGDLLIVQQYKPDGTTIMRNVQATVLSVSGNSISVSYQSGAFQIGDEVVRVGNNGITANRDASIYMTSDDTNSPYLDMITGVNSWSVWGLASKTKLRLGKLDGVTDSDYGALTGYGLYADNVYLKGTIRASAGGIGSWVITSTGLTSTNVGIYSSAYTEGAQIILGHSTSYASAKVGLKADGSGKLANGNFSWDASGNITGSGTWTNTATITGGTLRSGATSTQSVEMSGSGLTFYPGNLSAGTITVNMSYGSSGRKWLSIGGPAYFTYATDPWAIRATGNVTATQGFLVTDGTWSGSYFNVDDTGNIIKINNVTYSWPSSQGGVGTFLRNDGAGNLTWVASSSSVAWGAITGTLSAQTDLQNALNTKGTLTGTNSWTGANSLGTNGSLDISSGWFKLSKNNYPGGGVAGILYANNTMNRPYYTKSGGTVDSLVFYSEISSLSGPNTWTNINTFNSGLIFGASGYLGLPNARQTTVGRVWYRDGKVRVYNGSPDQALVDSTYGASTYARLASANSFTGALSLGTNGSLDINSGWLKLSKNNYPGGGVAGILYANNTMNRPYYTKSGGTVDSLAFYSEFEPKFTTLGISKGGTNASSFTTNEMLAFDGTRFVSTGFVKTELATDLSTSGNDLLLQNYTSATLATITFKTINSTSLFGAGNISVPTLAGNNTWTGPNTFNNTVSFGASATFNLPTYNAHPSAGTLHYESGLIKYSNGSDLLTLATTSNLSSYALTNQTFYLGTTQVAINRGSGALSLAGVSIDGNAGTVTNGVYTNTNQTISGIKTFTSGLAFSGTGTYFVLPTQLPLTLAGELAYVSGSISFFNGTTSKTLLTTDGSGASLTNLNASNLSSGTVAIARGGTNASSFTTNEMLYFNGTSFASTGFVRTELATDLSTSGNDLLLQNYTSATLATITFKTINSTSLLGSGNISLPTLSGTNSWTGANSLGTNGSLDISSGWFKLSKNNYPGGGVAGILYANNTMDRPYYTKSGGTVDSLALLDSDQTFSGDISFDDAVILKETAVSDTDTDIDATDKSYIRLGYTPGSYTISTISNGIAGQVLVLCVTSSGNTWTVNNGTSTNNIRLNGGSNYAMSQYDTLTLIFDSGAGTWIETARSNN